MAAFANFIEDPLRDYDMFFISFKKLLFYQHFDLLDRAITGNYDDVADSDKLWGYPEYDLALCKLYSELDGFYEIDGSVFTKDQLLKVLKRYRFDLDKKLLLSIEQGVFSEGGKGRKAVLDLSQMHDLLTPSGEDNEPNEPND